MNNMVSVFVMVCYVSMGILNFGDIVIIDGELQYGLVIDVLQSNFLIVVVGIFIVMVSRYIVIQ